MKDLSLGLKGLVAEVEAIEAEDTNYVSVNNSHWIVAVDCKGQVTILNTPNIHPGYLDYGSSYYAEEVGIPCESENDPGVYLWICNWKESIDYESGACEGGEFVVIHETPLWKVPSKKASEDTCPHCGGAHHPYDGCY